VFLVTFWEDEIESVRHLRHRTHLINRRVHVFAALLGNDKAGLGHCYRHGLTMQELWLSSHDLIRCPQSGSAVVCLASFAAPRQHARLTLRLKPRLLTVPFSSFATSFAPINNLQIHIPCVRLRRMSSILLPRDSAAKCRVSATCQNLFVIQNSR
jgi:hypothetical protein